MMDKRILKTLEYGKIIEMLSEKASSSLGRKRIEELAPSNDYDQVKERLEETNEGYLVLQIASSAPLGGVRDIQGLLKKAKIGAILEAYELLDVASTMYGMRQVKKFFKELEISVPILQNEARSLEILGQLENMINCTVDEHGAVRDNASVELQRIRREIKRSQSLIKERLDSVLRASEYQKYFQDVLITMRGDRYVVPIKQEYRQYFPGIVHDQSASGATLFIEPMAIVNLNNDVKQLVAAEHHELVRILKSITAQILKQAETLIVNCDILAHIDFIFAKAKLGQEMHATIPILNQEGYVELNKARHPLIEKDKVIPIDIKLGKEFKTLLITGPNTGGKTVSIKTMGLLSLMTQSGLFIPAQSDSKMPIFHNIFADIGDEQSIEQSLSTFSAHMTHLVKILSEIESDDLLLIDEIGAGTDPEEGAALAMAILEHLLRIGTKVIATTHYSELKTFAYSQDGIQNASVEFDITTLRPTYRLLIGIPGSSNAFAISSKLGLANSLIIRAKQLIDADHAQFENILNNLESEKLMYEQRNADMMERECQIRALEIKINAMRADLNAKKERIICKAQEESAALLRRTRRETEEIITELKEQFNDQGIKKRQKTIDDTRKKLKEGINAVRIKENTQQNLQPVKLENLKPGDAIYVTTLEQKGIVISTSGRDILVQLGIMKMTVPVTACMATGEDVFAKKQNSKQMNFMKVTNVQRQIDIRGMLVDEAEETLSKYIDDAVLAGLSEVLIIHGKGTGALRKGVRVYLDKHNNVLCSRMADMNEGGDGATVVQLK